MRCETCGAPVEPEQRYCVECGTHRVGVNDPAAAYMNRPPARAQRQTRAVVVSSRRNRWTTALMLAAIPVAIAIGVLVGRSSNNQDHDLLKALQSSRARVVTVQSGATKVVTVGNGGTVVSKAKNAKNSKTTKASDSASSSGSSSTAVGAKETKAEQKKSADTVKKLNNATGQNYLIPITSQVGGG